MVDLVLSVSIRRMIMIYDVLRFNSYLYINKFKFKLKIYSILHYYHNEIYAIRFL